MQEIGMKPEFRAYDTMNHKMIYPDAMTKSWDALMYKNGKYIEIQSHSHLVWMLYTGLKDSNQQKIYEGDMVNRFYVDFSSEKQKTVLCKVKWGGWCYQLLTWNGDGDAFVSGLDPIVASKIKIIGNIYTNKK